MENGQAALERRLVDLGRSFTQPLMTAVRPKLVIKASLTLPESGRAQITTPPRSRGSSNPSRSAIRRHFILMIRTRYAVVAGSTVNEWDRTCLTRGDLPICRAIALSAVMVLR